MKNRIYLLAALFLYLLPAKAQVAFNIPFMIESPEPELYILEPNYGKDGQVEYYSLADLMKVQYTYNDQRRPLRKILYVMDKYICQWEEMMVTDFIYQNNCLVSEQVVQLSDGDSIYRINRDITYDDKHHTDTTRTTLEWLDKQYEGRVNLNVDEDGYTIRYLNRHNQPDSAIYIYQQADYSFRLKYSYTYNKKQQLIASQFYNKIEGDAGNVSWQKVSEYEIKRDKNQIEYTLKTKMFDAEAGEYMEDLDSATYAKHLKDVILQYVMSTDKAGRITNRQLRFCDHLVMDNQLSYNVNGQTDVNQKFDLDERFMHIYGMSGMNGSLRGILSEMKHLRYTVTHQGDCKQSVFSLDEQQKKVEFNTCFLPDGKLHTIEMIRYDDGEVDDHDKYEYKYLSDGFVEKIEYTDYGDGLEPHVKLLYKEDSEGRTLYKEKFLSDESKQWKPEEKGIYAYDKYGNKCHHETYLYDTYGGNKSKWRGDSWKEWVYDAKKQNIELRTKIWEDGKWNNSRIEQTAYDDDGRKILDASYRWHTEEQSWLGVSKDSMYFDDARTLTGSIRYEWDRKAKTWSPGWRKETETETKEDPTGWGLYSSKRVTTFIWEKDKWLPNEQRVDKNDWKESFYSISLWNEEKQKWITERKEIKKTEESGATLIEEYKWNEELGELDGIENTLTIALGEGGRNNKRVIYRAWDRKTKSWKDKIACNMFSVVNNETYIYENWNEESKRWEYNRKVELKELTGGRSELVQSFWNDKNNTWELDRKTLSYYKNDKPFRKELFVYNKNRKLWTPTYCSEEVNPRTESAYYKWNAQQQKWGYYLVRKESGWSEKCYLWDEQTNKFVEIDYYKYESLKSAVEQEMNKIDSRTLYYNVMNK